MTTKTWDGSTNDFNLPQHWSLYGTPQNGDTANIHNGFAELAFGDLREAPVDLGSTDANNPAVFANYDDFLGNVTVHGDPLASGPHYTAYAQMNVSGGGDIGIGALNVGTYDPGAIGVPGNLQMYIAENAQFVSTGSVTVEGGSTFDVHSGDKSSFVNDSSLVDLGSHIDMQTPVIGSGTFTVAVGPRQQGSDLTFESYVTGGEQLSINGQYEGPAAKVTVNDAAGFAAGVTLNPGGDLFLNTPLSAASYSYQNGVFTDFDNLGRTLASFELNTPSGSFSVSHQGNGTLIQGIPSSVHAEGTFGF